MKFVVGRDAEVLDYTSHNIGHPLAPSCIAFGVIDGDDPGGLLHGGVVLSGWNGANIYITIWMPGCLKRNLIRDCYRYVFNQLGCQRMSAHTKRENLVMRKLFPRLGFEFEGMQKRYFGPSRGEDALQFVLTRDNAQKWMD
jgi:RimJ/RimL family protein N-acetyltransferase